MLIDTGNGIEYLTTIGDFYDVLRRRTSDEFLREFENLLARRELEIEEKWEDCYGLDSEALEEAVRIQLTDIRDMLESDVRPLKEGKRINRKAIIESFDEAIKMIDYLLGEV